MFADDVFACEMARQAFKIYENPTFVLDTTYKMRYIWKECVYHRRPF